MNITSFHLATPFHVPTRVTSKTKRAPAASLLIKKRKNKNKNKTKNNKNKNENKTKNKKNKYKNEEQEEHRTNNGTTMGCLWNDE